MFNIADSFFEWKKTKTGKISYRIILKTGDHFAFAGLWDLWEREGVALTSCTIITTSPNKLVADIHGRMPVILDQDAEKEWLGEISVDKAIKLLNPFKHDIMI